MSALGDIPHTPSPEDQLAETRGKIHDVSIPLCVLHALDDPLITWRSVANNKGPMHPYNLTRNGSGNIMVLLTKGGGHVGWPIGNMPFVDKWKWMSNAAMSFAHAVDKAKKEHIPKK
jgi:predicted alpha/beta-fold hydrolase